MPASEVDRRHMSRALELAARGEGRVEPNPMVGCVIAHDDQVVGEGWHQQFGGPHAEVEALRRAGAQAAGATLYVTLEPCCHQGKTPPCTRAIIDAGVRRVVVAQSDPFPSVSGAGIRQLEAAQVLVETNTLAAEAADLNAPYLKLVRTGQPWVLAKWAMSLDGKLATREADSQWISNAASRHVGHRLRGRMDAIIVGRATAQIDDPRLTARPPGPRTPMRIVLDSNCQLATSSELVRTIGDAPLCVAAGPEVEPRRARQLRDAGCEVLFLDATEPGDRFMQLLDKLGERRLTNVMVEGGGQVLGTLLDRQVVDEVHAFIAPKLIGGAQAVTIAGLGVAQVASGLALESPVIEQLNGDVYLHGRVKRGRKP